MSKPTFLYVTYIATTIEQLWDAITSDSFTCLTDKTQESEKGS
ncbi:hypothetical protein ACKFKF_27555 [Phormidesmis sp. 146-12]